MKKKENFIVRKIAGEVVMVPTGETAIKCHGLVSANETAQFVWENIEKTDSPQQMAELICEKFEVSYEKALSDMTELFSQLIKAGWIE